MPVLSFYVSQKVFGRLEYRIALEGVRRNRFLKEMLISTLDDFDGKLTEITLSQRKGMTAMEVIERMEKARRQV